MSKQVSDLEAHHNHHKVLIGFFLQVNWFFAFWKFQFTPLQSQEFSFLSGKTLPRSNRCWILYKTQLFCSLNCAYLSTLMCVFIYAHEVWVSQKGRSVKRDDENLLTQHFQIPSAIWRPGFKVPFIITQEIGRLAWLISRISWDKFHWHPHDIMVIFGYMNMRCLELKCLPLKR